MPVSRKCANCGKQLAIPPSRAKDTLLSFCNRFCMVAHRKQTGFYKGANNPNWRGGCAILTCVFCGRAFKVKPSHINKRQCCSRECKAQFRSENALGYDPRSRIAKTCKICGTIILVKNSHHDYEGTYCSRDCMAESYQDILRGDKNPNYKDGRASCQEYQNEQSRKWRVAHPEQVQHWNRQTKAMRKQAEGTFSETDIAYHWRQQRGQCVYCGIALDAGYHVDHIIPISRGGSNFVGNIQLLCPSCNLQKRAMLPIEFKVRQGILPWLSVLEKP